MSLGKALYDFNLDGAFENCMFFRAGEMISLLEKRDDGWWQGSTATSVGWFPGNYVAIVEDLPPPPPEEPAAASPAAAEETPKAKLKRRQSRAFVMARATIDFVPNAYDDDAIGFKKNDQIVVFEKNSTGQWKGKSPEGRVGYFPSRYVEIIEDEDEEVEFELEGEAVPGDDDVIVPAKPIEIPVKKEEPPPPASGPAENIPIGWKKVKASNGTPYYYNMKTYERAWTIDDINMGPGEPLPELSRADLQRSQSFVASSLDISSAPAPDSPTPEHKPIIIAQKPQLKQAPAAPGPKPSTPTTAAAPVIPVIPQVVPQQADLIKEKERELEFERKRAEEVARREVEEKKRLEMMLQETQKRLDEEKKRAKLLEESAEERKRLKEQAEREAAAALEKRLREQAEREIREREELKRLEQLKSTEEIKKIKEQQEKEAAEKARMEQKLRELEKKLEDERLRTKQIEEEERKQREQLEEQRLQRQREFEEQQRLFREQEMLERKRFEEEKERLRLEMEAEKKKMEAMIREKHQAEVEAARKEEEKMRKMAEELARQEQERIKLAKEAEEKRLMQQKLLEAEASLMKEKKKIEEMEQNRELLEMEKQLEEERKKMEDLMLELSQVDFQPQEAAAPKVAPKDSLVKQRRLSTFIENIDLPAPPSAPPKLPPVPKVGSMAGMKLPPALPPSIVSLPPPVATALPPPPAAAAAAATAAAAPRPTLPPVQAPPVNLPPPPTALPPPPNPKPKVAIASRFELDKLVNSLGHKTDTCFNVFLQAGRERNLNTFIEGMKDSTACIKEILSLASGVAPVESLQPKLTTYMNSLSTSLKSLLLTAKSLANAIEQGQPTIAILLSLEKIASEVLITKYDILDFLNTNGSAFFCLADPMKEVYTAMAKKMEEHVDSITQSIKYLANVARATSQKQYQDAAGSVITGASEMRNFLSDEIMKTNDFNFKQTLNFALMQLSDSLTLLIQSSNNASRTNNPESVQVMVNCAVKIARITKEAHVAITTKAQA